MAIKNNTFMKFVFKCTDTHFCNFLEGIYFELQGHEECMSLSLLGNAKQFSKIVVYLVFVSVISM